MSGEFRGLPSPSGEDHWAPVCDEPDVNIAILLVGKVADRLGLKPVARASIMTAASELARNIIKYAGRGRMRIRLVQGPRGHGIEVVAEDNGPGIADLQKAMQDHFSESGTLGLGLPGAKRLMDDFHLWSEPGKGTRVTVRKWKT
jgi:serine/threonine-protein kinase RsbT